METHTAMVIPSEGEFKVYSATQWVERVQSAVASVLGVPASAVDVSVKRIGGAYGAKTTRPNLVAAACALGASVTGRSDHVIHVCTLNCYFVCLIYM